MLSLQDSLADIALDCGDEACDSNRRGLSATLLLRGILPWHASAIARYASLPDALACALADSLGSAIVFLLAEAALATVRGLVEGGQGGWGASVAASVGGLVRNGWGSGAVTAAAVAAAAGVLGAGAADYDGSDAAEPPAGGANQPPEDRGHEAARAQGSADGAPAPQRSIVGVGGLVRMLWHTVQQKSGRDTAAAASSSSNSGGGGAAGTAAAASVPAAMPASARSNARLDGGIQPAANAAAPSPPSWPWALDASALRALLAARADAPARWDGRRRSDAPDSKATELPSSTDRRAQRSPTVVVGAPACGDASLAPPAWVAGVRATCAALAALEALPPALEAQLGAMLGGRRRVPVAWEDGSGIPPPVSAPPAAVFERLAAAAAEAIAGTLLTRFAEAARPWLFLANAWAPRTYPVSLSPAEAAGLARGALLAAAAELGGACAAVARWHDGGDDVGDGAGSWAVAAAAAVWAGLDALVFQAIVHPDGVDAAAAAAVGGGRARAIYGSGSSEAIAAPPPSACRHLLATLPADLTAAASVVAEVRRGVG